MFTRKRSVASIAAGINKMIEDLQAVVTSTQEEIDAVNSKIADLKGQRDFAYAEQAQAETVSANLRSLLGAV